VTYNNIKYALAISIPAGYTSQASFNQFFERAQNVFDVIASLPLSARGGALKVC
jgi:hypothetical protein